jgi:hypothetical protein
LLNGRRYPLAKTHHISHYEDGRRNDVDFATAD